MSKKLFYTKMGWENCSEKDIIRTIKLFALINSSLVIPSNHIYSDKAEKLFRRYPELLEKKIIKPALAKKFLCFEDYLLEREDKAGRKLKDYGRYLDSLDSCPERYSTTAPAEIFTKNILDQVERESSVIYRAANLDDVKSRNLISKIESSQKINHGVIYFREFLEIIEQNLSGKDLLVFRKYAFLLRYIAGASSKKCHNLLPQENLIDWCLANPQKPGCFILQDEQLFWEVFLESLIRITEGIFPLNDLERLTPTAFDRLTFGDIDSLRSDGILRGKFIDKYNSIIDKINSIRVSSENKLDLVDYESLILIKEELKQEFEIALSKESSIYKKIVVWESLARVAYQLYGGPIQTIESVINFFCVTLNKKSKWNKFVKKQTERINLALKFVVNRLSGESILIDYMELLAKKARNSWYK